MKTYLSKKVVLSYVVDVIFTLLGTAIFALGLYVFSTPNNIAPGGVSGISIILNYLINVPVGIISFVINVPLIIIGIVKLGKHFIIKSTISVFAFTIFYDYVYTGFDFPIYEGDIILAALFGGVVMGLGCAFTFMRESSLGGGDIWCKLIQKKFPHLQIGRLIFLSDVVVILVSALVFRNIDVAMYAIISMFVCGFIIDAVLYGLDVGKMVFIMSSKSDEVCQRLLLETDRGVTKIKTVGGYSNKDSNTLLCAVKRNEYYHLKKIVYEIDPSAFIIVSTANEVVGEGFKSIEK